MGCFSARMVMPLADAANSDDAPERDAISLELELERAENVWSLILKADQCLKTGDRASLCALGFSEEHAAALMKASKGGRSGYPLHAKRNARWHLAWVRRRASESA